MSTNKPFSFQRCVSLHNKGKSVAEISQLMGASLEKVEQALARATRKHGKIMTKDTATIAQLLRW